MFARRGGQGIGDIRDRSDSTMWLCNWTPARWTPMCAVPTEEEIAADTSDYGGHLDPEARAVAQQRALEVIQSMKLCDLKSGFIDKVKCQIDTGDYSTVILIGAAVIGVAVYLGGKR